jgi:hypothetical protein
MRGVLTFELAHQQRRRRLTHYLITNSAQECHLVRVVQEPHPFELKHTHTHIHTRTHAHTYTHTTHTTHYTLHTLHTLHTCTHIHTHTYTHRCAGALSLFIMNSAQTGTCTAADNKPHWFSCYRSQVIKSPIGLKICLNW